MTAPPFQFSGPILGIDHGTKVIGLALSQTGYFAKPLRLLHRKSKAEDFAQLNQIIAQEKISAIVLGLPPVPPDFVGHSQADTVRNWAGHFSAALHQPLPIYLWDEGLSTVDAEALLAEAGKRRPERSDAYAAALILQGCLDWVREQGQEPLRFTPDDT